MNHLTAQAYVNLYDSAINKEYYEFFLFGTGPCTIKRILENGKVLMYRYRVFHLFFLFTFVFPYGKGYDLATETPDGWNYKHISEDEAKQLLNGETLQPGFWAKWSLAIIAGIVILATILGQLAAN